MRLPLIFYKITRYEYWNMNILYVPVYLYHFGLSVKCGHFFWGTAANPGLDEYGGLFGESKSEILKIIPEAYLPAQIFIPTLITANELKALIHEKGINYPVIAKPDVGERGNGVTVIKDEKDWEEYTKTKFVPYVIQEFIQHPVELGVFYIKDPKTGIGKVTSITLKKFLTAIGDGKTTLGQWVENNTRARFQAQRLKLKFANEWDRVLNKGEHLLLEPIGNHCLGTEFVNGNHMLCKEVDAVFNSIAESMPGYYYGRFDLKVSSEGDFIAGKNIRIMEFNGVSAEPAHIYDTRFTYFMAMKDLIKHWRMMFQVSSYNIKHGVKPVGFFQTIKRMNNHFKTKE